MKTSTHVGVIGLESVINMIMNKDGTAIMSFLYRNGFFIIGEVIL